MKSKAPEPVLVTTTESPAKPAHGLSFMTWMHTEGGRKCPMCGKYARTSELGWIGFHFSGGVCDAYGHLPGFGCNKPAPAAKESSLMNSSTPTPSIRSCVLTSDEQAMLERGELVEVLRKIEPQPLNPPFSAKLEPDGYVWFELNSLGNWHRGYRCSFGKLGERVALLEECRIEPDVYEECVGLIRFRDRSARPVPKAYFDAVPQGHGAWWIDKLPWMSAVEMPLWAVRYFARNIPPKRVGETWWWAMVLEKGEER